MPHQPMFIGHYSTAFAARRIVSTLSLPAWFIACQLVDLFWGMLVLFGIEKLRVIPDFNATNGLDLYFMPYTHSLPAAAIWSVSAAFIIWLCMAPSAQRGRTAVVFGLVVGSHWLLDLMVHVPDLPLWFDGMKVGMGWWNYRVFAMLLELVLFWSGVLLALPSAGENRKRYLLLAVVMSAIQVSSLFLQAAAPVPVAMELLATHIGLIGAAYWADRRQAGPVACAA